MAIWSTEIKELEKLYESFKGQLPELEKELAQLIHFDDPNVILLYSRRCLEVIITDLCECELKRPRKTEPLQGIIDKLNKENKVPSHIIASMHSLNSLSTFGTHPKDFDPEQIKPVLVNLDIVIKWYLKYKDYGVTFKQKAEAEKHDTGFSEISTVEKSIAVLPFIDMSPEKNQDYFCEGISEEIINTLSHIENFKVIARTSAFAFKNKQVDIREIGRMLDVETLLEGSIQKSGDRIRITAKLIKVVDGSHIWSERYDRDIRDVFAIQDEISLAIADNLEVKLLGDKKQIAAKRHSENLEAYNLFLKGTYCYQMMTAEGFKKGVEYFNQALQKDPNYATAYSGLAAVLAYSAVFGNLPPDKAFPKGIEYINKALKIDSNCAAPYTTLGAINTFYYCNWKEAEWNFKHALQINPNRALSHCFYSHMLTVTRRFKEALYEIKRAQELDPLSAYINTFMAYALYYAGQHKKAIEEFRMTLELNSNYFLAHTHLGMVYLLKSEFEEAVIEFEKAVDLSGGNAFPSAFLVVGYYKIGKKDLADKLFEILKKKSETEYVPATSFYIIHRFREEEDLSLEWLKRACDEHDPMLPWYRVDPTYIPEGSKYIKLLKERGMDY